MEPLVFEPYLRPMVWGGRRLGECFGKVLPAATQVGESWEISAHPHHVSRVAEGPLRDALLTDLCADRSADLFGDQAPRGNRFPLLVKLLDCCDLLSIQVHPSDELAPRLTPEASGKTEAWVVLEVQPTGRIYSGLKPGIRRSDLEQHLAAGTLEQCLHSYTPRPGDCVFLPAGTVHAVGGGVVMAEVQQTSDATFRLYDWNRPGSDGRARPLHIREALESINWTAGPVGPVGGTRCNGLPGDARRELLVRCPYFILQRFHARTPLVLPSTGRLSLWLVLDGTAELRDSVLGYRRPFRCGETVLVPAACPRPSWHPAGPVSFLSVTRD
jgi:mannose-6-phosphate isomerase